MPLDVGLAGLEVLRQLVLVDVDGELLLLEGRTDEAVAAFEASLERTPNRQNALNGVEQAIAAL
jgi:predicted negative regulator of RcsB-dependent stress response